MIAQPMTAEMKRDGEIVNNPVVELLADITIIYKLDSQGAINEIVGYEKLPSMISAQVPPQIANQLSQLLNPDTLKQKEVSEWNGRIGDFLGKTVSINETWEHDIPYTLPNGVNLNYSIRTLFASEEKCGKAQCLRIEQVYDSEAEGIAEVVTGIVESVAEAAKPGSSDNMPKIEEGDSSIKGEAVRLIDPATMLIYHEESQRTMEMKMEMPGVGQVPTKMIEKRVYEFDYEN
jgi:hypothetical protein